MQEQTTQNNLPTKFLIIGRTSSGKSSIAKGLCERFGFKQVKSMATRPKRKNEENEENCDHYFVTDEEFDIEEEKGLAAYTEINNYRYATTFEELDKSNIYVIDPNGAQNLKQTCSDKYNFIEIYIRVPFNTAKMRFKQRGGTEAEFKRRYDQENAQFKEYEDKQLFDYHILNDGTIEEAVDKACGIINKATN